MSDAALVDAPPSTSIPAPMPRRRWLPSRAGVAVAISGIGRLEIKKRGVDIDPAAFRTALKLRGDGSATLILTRLGSKRLAILADRVPG